MDYENTTSEDSNSPEDKKNKSERLNKYGELLESKFLSDFILVVKGTEIHAHRVILSGVHYFKRMLTTNTEEKINGKVIINDAEPHVIKFMLEFIYKGTLSNEKLGDWKQCAKELLIVANKYGIDGLQNKIEKYLNLTLSIENAVDLMLFSGEHNAIQLETSAIEFIKRNLPEVKTTSGFKNLKRTNELAAKIFDSFSPSKRPKLSD